MIYDLAKFKAAKQYRKEVEDIIKDLEQCEKALQKHVNKTVRIRQVLREIDVSKRVLINFLNKANDLVKLKGRV